MLIVLYLIGVHLGFQELKAGLVNFPIWFPFFASLTLTLLVSGLTWLGFQVAKRIGQQLKRHAAKLARSR